MFENLWPRSFLGPFSLIRFHIFLIFWQSRSIMSRLDTGANTCPERLARDVRKMTSVGPAFFMRHPCCLARQAAGPVPELVSHRMFSEELLYHFLFYPRSHLYPICDSAVSCFGPRSQAEPGSQMKGKVLYCPKLLTIKPHFFSPCMKIL